LILRALLGRSPPFVDLLILTFVSLFAAHLVAIGPSADVVRAGYGKLVARLPLSAVIISIIYDRTLALLASAGVGLLFLPAQIAFGIPADYWIAQGALWTLCFVALACAVIGAGRLGRVFPYVQPYVAPARDFVRVIFMRDVSARQLFLATLHPATFGIGMWLLAQGMGLQLSVWVLLAFSPLFIVGQSLPFLFVGWGLRETIVVTALATTGLVTQNEALALSIATGGVFFIATLPGLPLMLVLRDRFRL
jgi:hypothetical protein